MTVVDPHRPGYETSYYPGETNVRLADVVVVNKVDSAPPENVTKVVDRVSALNPHAIIVRAASPIAVDDPGVIRGKRVLVRGRPDPDARRDEVRGGHHCRPTVRRRGDHRPSSLCGAFDDAAARTKTFEEVDLGISTEEVKHEASRCLTCGCKTVYDCDLKDYSTEAGATQGAYRGKFKKYTPDAAHPYVALDPNKCILCGRCVRYCGDLIGIYALGFINRGFETMVKPAMDKPLAETTCMSCGNCIEVCPTGAIEFNSAHKNPGVFRTFKHRSVCSDCGVGCEIDLNAFDRDAFYITAKPLDAGTVPARGEKSRE